MAEYIDKSQIHFDEWENHTPKARHSKIMIAYKEQIDRIPIADVAPVARSKWNNLYDTDILFENTYECDSCKQTFVFEEGPEMCNANYCPNCGARMNGKEKINGNKH